MRPYAPRTRKKDEERQFHLVTPYQDHIDTCPASSFPEESKMSSKFHKILPGIALLILVGGVGWWWTIPRPAASPAASPAIPVETATVERRDVPIELQGLATVQAFHSVLIRPQVDGQLKRIVFTEGQEVHAGDLLAEIDARGFQAALDQARAKKSQDEAQLANARVDLQRYGALVDKNYIARQQVDTTRAQVAQLEATCKG